MFANTGIRLGPLALMDPRHPDLGDPRLILASRGQDCFVELTVAVRGLLSRVS